MQNKKYTAEATHGGRVNGQQLLTVVDLYNGERNVITIMTTATI